MKKNTFSCEKRKELLNLWIKSEEKSIVKFCESINVPKSSLLNWCSAYAKRNGCNGSTVLFNLRLGHVLIEDVEQTWRVMKESSVDILERIHDLEKRVKLLEEVLS